MPQSEPEWIEKARKTFDHHRQQLVKHDKWTIAATAKDMNRSFGSVSEDILLIRWWRTHENQLRKFNTAYEALRFIRERKRAMEIEEAS